MTTDAESTQRQQKRKKRTIHRGAETVASFGVDREYWNVDESVVVSVTRMYGVQLSGYCYLLYFAPDNFTATTCRKKSLEETGTRLEDGGEQFAANFHSSATTWRSMVNGLVANKLIRMTKIG